MLPKPPWTTAKMNPVTMQKMMRMIVPCRMRITGVDGTWKLSQNKPDAVRLADGDALVLDQGGKIVVRAAMERVADLQCGDPADALRLAWHIGNRHTPVQVLPGGVLRIAHDHVLVAMARGLGASATERNAPFQPEGGAYAPGHGHAH